MGERKHVEKGNETKAIQAKREEEQRPDKQPAEAVSRLSANAAQPEDIQALQRTVGNRAVTNMIQRHMSDEADSQHTRGASQFHEAVLTKAVPAADRVDAGAKDWRAASNAMVEGYNDMFRAATKARAEPCGAEATEGGGESQSPQGGEDIYEGGGE
ncbi:MAG: hypothetical protein WA996_17550 [Candidatus Promineifilaceae bacterium]